MKNETQLLFLLIVVIQIFLLVNFTPAESYLINQADNIFGDAKIENRKGFDKTFNFGLNLITGILSIKQIGVVSASVNNPVTNTYEEPLYQGEYKSDYNEFFTETDGISCCEIMNNGAICQNVPMDFNNCKGDILPLKCQENADCKPGCCFDNQEGLCSTGSPREKCENSDGEWSDDSKCNIDKCQKGCCILGGNVDYITEKRCEYLTKLNGFNEINFEQKISEIQCLIKAEKQDYGACFSGNRCSFGTKANCIKIIGDTKSFYNNTLCSNTKLDNDCAKQKYIGCVEGKDEIYWFDSCGNRENIYSSDKEKSWNNGSVLSKEKSCGSNSANINSENCGNCNYILGSKCSQTKLGEKSVKDGKYICKDMTCVDEKGKLRQNGESWCVYDSFIGDGKDTVGSRHWKRICIDGEIKVEGCADFRNEICAENKTLREDGKEISTATCRINRWKNCIGINSMEKNGKKASEEERKKACEKDVDCLWKTLKIGDAKVNLCEAKYPVGFERNGNVSAENKELCSFADQKCTVVFVCGKCVANCECLEEKFTKGMNDYCMSLGDCGASVNYVGDITNTGYKIKKGKKLSKTTLANLAKYSIPVEGQFVELGNISDYYDFPSKKFLKNIKGSGKGGGGGGSGGIMGGIVGGLIGLLSFGWIFGIIGAIIGFIIASLFGSKCKIKKVKVEFNCLPWQAPTQNQKCDKCNGDPFKSCTQYRCSSLGTACELLNKDTEFPVCFEKNTDDKTPPTLTIGKGFDVLKLTQENKNIKVRTLDGKCVPAFTPLAFTLDSDEPAECRYIILNNSEFDEMDADFVEGNSFTLNHTFATIFPSIRSLEAEYNFTIEGEDLDKIANMKYYVKCQDTHGNKNPESYVLDICISNELDNRSAEIIATLPANSSYVRFDSENIEANFWLNEPAECKWDVDSSKSYNSMSSLMNCSTELVDVEDIGWKCVTTLPILNSGENNFYIKCKDQPWLPAENDSQRNINIEPFTYTLYKSSGELKINKIEPQGIIKSGFEPISIELNVETSGEADDSVSICEYKFEDKNWRGIFYENERVYHKQKFSSLMSGNYKINVTCEDIAGNTADAVSEFNLELDKEPPMITRVYNSGGKLKIITDEDAECYYDTNRCNFNSANATLMTSAGYMKEHSAEWNSGIIYYVKCEDVWGNKPNECSIKIIPSI